MALKDGEILTLDVDIYFLWGNGDKWDCLDFNMQGRSASKWEQQRKTKQPDGQHVRRFHE